MDERLEVNLALWDERAPAHAASPDYAVDRFAADPSYLSEVVRFDLPLLGDVTGLRGVHLQCHIGTDTVSLSRLGAAMTGLDFSSASVAEARRVAERAGAPVDFVLADVHDAATVLGEGGFDLVYTGVGALCWLPSVERWARVVASLLRPGGRLHLREGHPVLWALDDTRTDGALVLAHPYFERAEPLVWDEPGTYVETDASFTHTVSAEWNHGIGEIVTALLGAGLEVTGLTEHRSVPWQALPQAVADERGEWSLPHGGESLPLSYTLTARKPTPT
ncbi:class I SAM-dependent methyltransferase [Nocardioides lentus]|uniref:Class I SAM-dependent methyltransferase n=1 Tax=Nocardioides lentus TaxID=338077 RepID=A0ABP5AN26_9ACTN